MAERYRSLLDLLVSRARRARFWADLHHHANTIGWTEFFAQAALIFLTFNCLFATLYWFDAEPIANIDPPGFFGLFFFSIETLSTIGYGDMHPRDFYAHAVATVETFTGMSLVSVMTGLVFTRFSLPRARILFADHPTISAGPAGPILTIHISNARDNTITASAARLWMVTTEIGPDGAPWRCNRELPLLNADNPDFSREWTVSHPIQPGSPLDRRPHAARHDTTLVLVVSGIDETTTQQLNARRSWGVDELTWLHDDLLDERRIGPYAGA